MENKKIKNATTNIYDGITFKSLLEKRAYQLFKESGLEPQYECNKITIFEGYKPTIPFYKPVKKELSLYPNKVRDITYSPDLTIVYKGKTYFIELKGFVTEKYAIKVKMFRKWLEDKPFCEFFELHSVKDIKSAIGIIKSNG